MVAVRQFLARNRDRLSSLASLSAGPHTDLSSPTTRNIQIVGNPRQQLTQLQAAPGTQSPPHVPQCTTPPVPGLPATGRLQCMLKTVSAALHTASIVPAPPPPAAIWSVNSQKARAKPSHDALLVDAAGTLVVPSEPAAKVYRELGLKYGVCFSEEEILGRYRWAYEQPWRQSRLRYVDDGRPFWRFVVGEATGCSDENYFSEVYDYYAKAEAWRLVDPDAGAVFAALRRAGVKLAVVSNFDTRLRLIMRRLGCDVWFDAMAVSAEVEYEKPNPTIFLRACELLAVDPARALHVGDDRRNDVWGARDAGCDAWMWGYDVQSFREVAERMGVDVNTVRP